MTMKKLMSAVNRALIGSAIGCLFAIMFGCLANVDSATTVEDLRAGPCSYRLTLGVVTANRENLTVDITVENTSDRTYGWDSEFACVHILARVPNSPDKPVDAQWQGGEMLE